MKFSVVTISFNQAKWLGEAMDSVLSQQGVEIEYIVCDPGSTDGSRDLIEAVADPRMIRVFEKDSGPGDGLNKGFARASGDIWCYLNSDDAFLPGAFAKVADYFARHPQVDVVTGHALAIDHAGGVLRKVWSEPFDKWAVATGAHVQIQPSTFFRAEAFRRTDGFDPEDRASWDTGLLVAMHCAGARIAVIDEFLSCYRLHAESITMSGRLKERQTANMVDRFSRLVGRPYAPRDRMIGQGYRLLKHLRWPHRALHRALRGPMTGRRPD
ncbi:MAG: glycosyltransferase [Sphingomonadales bacterium]|nr:glycosyltransferase [Sphingomonadales bacterium]MBD3774792.1 glycosyltransferase [Paracoccaceae bacterium]